MQLFWTSQIAKKSKTSTIRITFENQLKISVLKAIVEEVLCLHVSNSPQGSTYLGNRSLFYLAFVLFRLIATNVILMTGFGPTIQIVIPFVLLLSGWLHRSLVRKTDSGLHKCL